MNKNFNFISMEVRLSNNGTLAQLALSVTLNIGKRTNAREQHSGLCFGCGYIISEMLSTNSLTQSLLFDGFHLRSIKSHGSTLYFVVLI